MSPMNEVLVGKYTFKKLSSCNETVSIMINTKQSVEINTDLVHGYLYFKKEDGYAKLGFKTKKPLNIHYVILLYKDGEKSLLVLDNIMYELIKKCIPRIKEEEPEE